jgi:hypothetical protein
MDTDWWAELKKRKNCLRNGMQDRYKYKDISWSRRPRSQISGTVNCNL